MAFDKGIIQIVNLELEQFGRRNAELCGRKKALRRQLEILKGLRGWKT